MSANLPVNIADELKRELQSVTKTLMPVASNKISTKGKVFTLPSGTSSPGPLSCVVLDFAQFNSFYKGAWNPNVPQMPVCWAIGKDKDTLKPSTAAPEPQFEACTGCPKDEWGSGAGKGKACKNQFRLVLVEPNFTSESQPMTLYVSPSGMKHWSNYVRELKTVYELLPVQVITKIAFDANAPYPTLTFSIDAPHSKIEIAWALRQKAHEMLMREPDSNG
jgi:hypothetical protein